MEYAEFIKQVQDRAGIASFDEAENAVLVTLEMFGNRMGMKAAEHIAGQLPPDLASYIIGSGDPDLDIHDLKELIGRVAKKEHAGYEAAESHVRAVFSVLSDAVSADAIRDAIAGLPRDMRRPFDKKLMTAPAGATRSTGRQ